MFSKYYRAIGLGLVCLLLSATGASRATVPSIAPIVKQETPVKPHRVRKAPNYETIVEYENYQVKVDTNSIQVYAQPQGLFIELTFQALPLEPHKIPNLPNTATKYENTVVVNCETQNVLLTHLIVYHDDVVMKDEPSAFLYSPPHQEFTPVAEIVKFLCPENDKLPLPADKL